MGLFHDGSRTPSWAVAPDADQASSDHTWTMLAAAGFIRSADPGYSAPNGGIHRASGRCQVTR